MPLKNSVDVDGDGTGDGNDALFVYNFAPATPNGMYEVSGSNFQWDDDLASTTAIWKTTKPLKVTHSPRI